MSKKILCGIYCIENIINNKKYIGLSSDITRRWHEHKSELRRGVHINDCLQKAWNKYGEQSFKFYIIELCMNEDLINKEMFYIEKYKTLTHENGYNITPGGEYNITNYKAIICLLDNEIYDTVQNAMRSLNVSYPTITDWCRKRKKYMYLDEFNTLTEYEKMYLKNFDWDEADHKKLSKAHSRENLSNDTLKKLSDATKGSNNPRAFQIYCPELDEVFWGAKEAQDKYGILRSSISQCISGKLKSAGKHPVTGEKLTWVKLKNDI